MLNTISFQNKQVHVWPKTALEMEEDDLEFFYNSEQVCETIDNELLFSQLFPSSNPLQGVIGLDGLPKANAKVLS